MIMDEQDGDAGAGDQDRLKDDDFQHFARR